MRKRRMFQSGWDLPVLLVAVLMYVISITVTVLSVFVGEAFVLYRLLAAIAILLFPLGVAIYGLSRRRAEKLWRRWLPGGIAINLCFGVFFLWLFVRPRA